MSRQENALIVLLRSLLNFVRRITKKCTKKSRRRFHAQSTRQHPSRSLVHNSEKIPDIADNSLWDTLYELTGREITALSGQSPYRILSVNESGVQMVTPSGILRTIPRQVIALAWSRLESEGAISRLTLNELCTTRLSPCILTLFRALPGMIYDRRAMTVCRELQLIADDTAVNPSPSLQQIKPNLDQPQTEALPFTKYDSDESSSEPSQKANSDAQTDQTCPRLSPEIEVCSAPSTDMVSVLPNDEFEIIAVKQLPTIADESQEHIGDKPSAVLPGSEDDNSTIAQSPSVTKVRSLDEQEPLPESEKLLPAAGQFFVDHESPTETDEEDFAPKHEETQSRLAPDQESSKAGGCSCVTESAKSETESVISPAASLDVDQLWVALRNLERRRIACNGHKAFTIVLVNDTHVFLQVDRVSTRWSIPRDKIEAIWIELCKYGELSYQQIEAIYQRQNSRYLALILAQLPGVKAEQQPVHLRYQPDHAASEQSKGNNSSVIVADVTADLLPTSYRPASATTLAGWEWRLERQMTGCSLLAEFDIAEEDTEHLSALIADLVHRRGFADATERLQQRYPRSFLAFLVFQGRYHYDRSYWPVICAATRIPRESYYASRWGNEALEVIAKLGLSRPADAPGSVGEILYQGGIPRSCLPSFFEHLLMPAMQRAKWSGLEQRQLIEAWQDSFYSRLTPQPVRRFLVYGGDVADTFIAHCRELADAPSSACPPGLPTYVAEAWHDWASTQSIPKTSMRSAHCASPRVVFDPWGEGVYLDLPEQVVYLESRWLEFEWQIELDDRIAATQEARARRIHGLWHLDSTTLALPYPARKGRIRLFADTQIVHEWPLPLNTSRGFLLFNPSSGALIEADETIALRSVWALCAPRTEIVATPKGSEYLIESFPPQSASWRDWIGVALRLDVASILTIKPPQSRPTSLRMAIDGEFARLVGGQRLDDIRKHQPLFVGTPPRLWVAAIGDSISEMSRGWSVELIGPDSIHAQRRSRLLSDCPACTKTEGGFDLPLDAIGLPANALGEYSLIVTSPTGSRRTLNFRIAPNIQLSEHTALHIPDEESGLRPVKFEIAVDADSQVELRSPSQSTTIVADKEDSDQRCYTICAEPNATYVALRIRRGANSGLPLDVPINRLRWSWQFSQENDPSHKWIGHCISIFLDELEQSDAPRLLVDLPVTHHAITWLRLYNSKEELIQELSPSRLRGQRFIEFNLGSVLDTLRESDSDTSILLEIEGMPGCNEPIRRRVLTVRRELHLQKVEAEASWFNSKCHLNLHWSPPLPLRHRQIRLWSLTRPWDSPTMLSIPDGNDISAHVHTATRVEPGEYLIEFVINNPWRPTPLGERPSAHASHVSRQRLGDLSAYISQIESRNDISFENEAELTLLHHALGNNTESEKWLQCCYEHISQAPIVQAIALIHELGQDPTTKAMRKRLFSAERIEQVCSGAASISDDVLRAYLRLRPDWPKLSLDSVLALAHFADIPTRYAAVRELLTRNQEAALDLIVDWIEDDSWGDDDILSLLSACPSKAADRLASLPLDVRVECLLDALASKDSSAIRLVRKGYWVCSAAGWGRVEGIESAQGEPIDSILIADLAEGDKLTVTLRADEDDAETFQITSRVGAFRIEFQQSRERWQCNKCERFVTRNRDRLSRHDRDAHEGMSRSLRPLREQALSSKKPLHFSVQRPRKIWGLPEEE